MRPRDVIAATLSLALSARCLGGCTTRYLRPPRAPERVVPDGVVAASPPREGEGQVTLDVVGGPARAELVLERTQSVVAASSWTTRRRGAVYVGGAQLTTRFLCVTPCAVNLPLGQHELSFAPLDPSSPRGSTGYVTVTPHPSVARHAMGRQEMHLGGVIAAVLTDALGLSAMLVGGALLAIDAGSTDDAHELRVPGIATLSAGAAALTVGVLLGLASRPESQPGRTVQWTP